MSSRSGPREPPRTAPRQRENDVPETPPRFPHSSDHNILSNSIQSSLQDPQRTFVSSETRANVPQFAKVPLPSSHSNDRNVFNSMSVERSTVTPVQATPYQQENFPSRQQYPTDQGPMGTASYYGNSFLQTLNNLCWYDQQSYLQSNQSHDPQLNRHNQFSQTPDNQNNAHANFDSMHHRNTRRDQTPSLPHASHWNNEGNVVTPKSTSRPDGRNLFMHNSHAQNSSVLQTSTHYKSTKRAHKELSYESHRTSQSHSSLLSKSDSNEDKEDNIANEEYVNVSCRCRKSQCIKLYCECFQSGSLCHSLCKCDRCVNTEAEMGQFGKLTIAKNDYLLRKPDVFRKKKKSVGGGGCACKNNR